MLGTSWPSMNSALPMPVPKVSRMTTPGTPLAAPKRTSASPAASASLSTVTSQAGRPWRTRRRRRCRSRSCRRWRPIAATPCLITAGKVAPTGPVQPACSTSSADHVGDSVRGGRLRGGDAHALGVQLAGAGVDDRALDAAAADVDPERRVGLAGLCRLWRGHRSSAD